MFWSVPILMAIREVLRTFYHYHMIHLIIEPKNEFVDIECVTDEDWTIEFCPLKDTTINLGELPDMLSFF